MVHLVTGLLPRATFRIARSAAPILLTVEETKNAVAALKEVENILNIKLPLADAMAALHDEKGARATKPAFQESADILRLALAGQTIKDPLRRIDLLQCLMASSFYAKAVDPFSVGDPRTAILSGYIVDVRRDSIITRSAHQTILEHVPSTKESDETLTNILLLERRIFGQNRLHQKSSGKGEQWLCVGVPLNEIKDEKELDRILALPPIKEHGNFIKRYDDPDPELKDAHRQRWKAAVISCGPEPVEVFDPTVYPKTETEWSLTILKPAPPVPFWARFRQKLLDIWIVVFTFWVCFWLIDEELFTIIALVYAKYQATKIMKEEAEKAGGAKIYVAKSSFSQKA
jgi:hypothetical protein